MFRKVLLIAVFLFLVICGKVKADVWPCISPSCYDNFYSDNDYFVVVCPTYGYNCIAPYGSFPGCYATGIVTFPPVGTVIHAIYGYGNPYVGWVWVFDQYWKWIPMDCLEWSGT